MFPMCMACVSVESDRAQLGDFQKGLASPSFDGLINSETFNKSFDGLICSETCKKFPEAVPAFRDSSLSCLIHESQVKSGKVR